MGDRTIAFLRADKNRPFCGWASFPDLHRPFDCPAPRNRLYRPDDVDLPEHRTMDLDRRPWWHRESLYGELRLGEPTLLDFHEKHSRTLVR